MTHEHDYLWKKWDAPNRQFWLRKSYAERLTALEELRREYHQWKYNAEPRLQRVCTVSHLHVNKKALDRSQDLVD